MPLYLLFYLSTEYGGLFLKFILGQLGDIFLRMCCMLVLRKDMHIYLLC